MYRITTENGNIWEYTKLSQALKKVNKLDKMRVNSKFNYVKNKRSK